MVSKGWENRHPWKMIPQLPSSSFNHLKGKASERVSHDPSDNHFQSLEISKKTAPNGRLCDHKARLLLISLSPPHFHLSTDSICHEEAGHQSSRSGRLCGGQQCACTSPLLCEEECRIFSSPPTCEWAPSALGEETSLRVQRLALADTCQLFGSQEVQPHFLFCSKGDPHNQPSNLEDIL